jgi:tellurite methyltransferase
MGRIDFDEQYKERGFYWSPAPNKYVRSALEFKKSGSVLDLGVGEGRNALFLAKNGFDVTGVDISGEGIKKFKNNAKKMKVKIKGIVCDIVDFKFDKKYDIILSIATLNFLKKGEIKKIIKKIKENTSPLGLNIITVFTVDNPGRRPSIYYFDRGELKRFYKDWRILKYREFISPLERHGKDGKWHRHGVAALIARKP